VTATAPPPAATAGSGSPRPPRLYRSAEGRLVGGVAQGLALHLGLDAWVVRAAFVLLAVSGGAGVVAYVAFWALVPLSPDGRPPGREPSTPAAGAPDPGRAGDDQTYRVGPLLALGALAVGGLLLVQQIGIDPTAAAAIPFLVLGLGVALLWRVADDSQRARWRRTARDSVSGRTAGVRVLLGLGLVVVGAAALVGAVRGVQAAVDGLVGGLVVSAGVALVAGPWLYRNARDRAEERRELIRSQERADLAAHVHDSVVQTLTLIQRNADDPREVTRLARSEERALRQWLYRRGGPDPGMFRSALESAAAEVEDAHGGTVSVVVVGDAAVDERLGALVQATREAMVNAVKYAAGGGPVSVFAEIEPTQASVFVRDRGPGFDLDAIPQDRLGVRESIVGRMTRHGGVAKVDSTPGEGTEVRLTMPVTSNGNGATPPPGAAPTGEPSRSTAGEADS
jgi:signal transduction histidine kinase/phage shock protein PspC (stress-responsive transcriptional regulator)